MSTGPEIDCDHCKRPFALALLHPVIVSGVQSYLGHLLTNKPEARRVPLCTDCYVAFKGATISGMVVKDDEEALAILGRTVDS
jgi:hypothetical protein